MQGITDSQDNAGGPQVSFSRFHGHRESVKIVNAHFCLFLQGASSFRESSTTKETPVDTRPTTVSCSNYILRHKYNNSFCILART